jgi:carboxylesterase type B
MYYYLILIACVSYNLINNVSADSPIVTTSLGQVKGSSLFIKEKNRTISVFQGIPYAKPPVGELRFKAAEPANKWNGVLDATHSMTFK